MLNAVMTARLDPETRADLARQYREDQSDSWSAARAAGLSAGVAEWLVMHARREQYRVAYRDFFRDWDVLLAPITLRNAFAHVDMSWPGLDSMRHVQLDVDGRPHPYSNQLVYLGVATRSGQPATAFPVGLSHEGMPMGLQAIGPYLEDMTPVRFAGLAAAELRGFVRPPGYDAALT